MAISADAPSVAFALVLGSLMGSLAVLWWLGVPLGRARDRLEERFILGVPWGTLVCVAGLFAVYLFVQRGWWHWSSPVVVAYTASSMADPAGWLFAGFAHSSPGHFRANLTSTLVFAPIVEWTWGHYPRSAAPDRGPEWLRRPVVRAVVIFPLAVGVIGVLAALFSWGPVIGFSVAVWALLGFALVHYPVLTLIALVARSTLRVFWDTLADPVVVSQTAVRAVRPSWFGTAVQGHLVGLLLGVVLGIALLRSRDRESHPARLWLCSMFVGMFLSLWALWWILGPEQFILFRGAGVALVFAVATVITVGAAPPTISRRELPVDLRRAAIAIILVSVLAMGGLGIAINLVAVETPDRPVAASYGDYNVYYGEDLPDGMVNVIDLEGFGLTTDVSTSGVIVVSESRGVWYQAVSATQLQTRGYRSFHVGGLGWSEEVTAVRQGWMPVGNTSVYQVWIGQPGSFEHAFASEAKRAAVIVDERRFSIEAADGQFFVAVELDGAVERVAVPGEGETSTVHGIEITRENRHIIARTDRTAVPIAARETRPG